MQSESAPVKVAFISRSTLFSNPGGDTRQMEMTASGLRKLGHQADIYMSSDHIDYSRYDLLHFFNIIRPADILFHIKKSRKPFLVSTIFVDYASFEKGKRTGIAGLLGRLLPGDAMEYVKAIARWLKNGEKLRSPEYLWKGHRGSIKYILRKASLLLPNSESEYRRLATRYPEAGAYRVIPNGVSEGLIRQKFTVRKQYQDAVICMGRIEGLKNQLALIRALRDSPHELFIHGKVSVNNQSYYNQCREAAEGAPNIHIGGWLEGDALYEAYSSARVHVLPSYFETTGLSSLEAAALGCNVVITDKGDTRDYFREDAWYCDPDNITSIRTAVDAAFKAPYNTGLRERILRDYTWEATSAATQDAYFQVLGKN